MGSAPKPRARHAGRPRRSGAAGGAHEGGRRGMLWAHGWRLRPRLRSRLRLRLSCGKVGDTQRTAPRHAPRRTARHGASHGGRGIRLQAPMVSGFGRLDLWGEICVDGCAAAAVGAYAAPHRHRPALNGPRVCIVVYGRMDATELGALWMGRASSDAMVRRERSV